MSNKIHTMQKVQGFDELQAQKKQAELQKASFVVNTRLRLAETFLNTLIGRADVAIEDEKFKEFLTDLSVAYANELMAKLGIVLPVANVE
jgi:hypothetical protein